MRRALVVLGVLGTAVAVGGRFGFSATPAARVLPAPVDDRGLAPRSRGEVAIFAGGCFWGIEAVFAHVKGVTSAVSGYAGGSTTSPTYEDVSSGSTGHAESVKVTFDPSQLSYGTLLRIFFSVAHDPTQLDRQGPDVGTQYRSAIFYVTEEQKTIAQAYIQQLTTSKVFRQPIVTRVDPVRAFFVAEEYHQGYAMRHPTDPYIATYDLPKLAALQRLFPELYRAE